MSSIKCLRKAVATRNVLIDYLADMPAKTNVILKHCTMRWFVWNLVQDRGRAVITLVPGNAANNVRRNALSMFTTLIESFHVGISNQTCLAGNPRISPNTPVENLFIALYPVVTTKSRLPAS